MLKKMPFRAIFALTVSCLLPICTFAHQDILHHIEQEWDNLTRSCLELGSSAADDKNNGELGIQLYIPRGEDLDSIAERSGSPAGSIAYLPEDGTALKTHALLYLPHPYVVPGGRFNEMYGWDSYFIHLGLLASARLELAKNLVDNQLYQITHYGKVLNANRTYYLSRSNPPFAAAMTWQQYKASGDLEWLRSCVAPLEAYYRYWMSPPHYTPETGLCRYYDATPKPCPEVLASELDGRNKTHYDRVIEQLKHGAFQDMDISAVLTNDTPTDQFYICDRAMRESGFDPTGAFGAFCLEIVHYNPVCLNALLYRYEMDMHAICTETGNRDKALTWLHAAKSRQERMNAYLWDAQQGMYCNYHIRKKAKSPYLFATVFYPLWAGAASREQAQKIAALLPSLERDGGIMTSTHESGCQWDAPFGWAPLQLIAVQGLRRYGFENEADRISKAFLNLVEKEYQRTGYIFEKYDVVRNSAEIGERIRFGYQVNETGFGWTNAVYLVLRKELAGLKQPR